jgi:putative membrane protein
MEYGNQTIPASRQVRVKSRTPHILFALYLVLFTALAVKPYSRAVWWAENLPIVLIVAGLALTFTKHRFSNTAYLMMSCLIYLHTIGGHFTFERVPFGLVTDLFGFERNHYDRIAHFSVGFYAYPVAELLLTKRWVSSRLVLFLFPVFTIFAVAAIYEIIEWLYAVLSDPEAGSAFLGSQGDIWDAQKDMLADGLGSLLAVALFWRLRRREMAALAGG